MYKYRITQIIRIGLTLFIGLLSFNAWSFSLDLVNDTCAVDTQKVKIIIHRTSRLKTVKSPPKLDTDELWLSAQIKEANQLFKTIGVCFVITETHSLPKSESSMKTRKQRTQLGRLKGRLTRGAIDLFIVNRLEDVDVKDTEIRGVHWRDPKDRRQKRWIILSRIARSKVLAHELGHYFDLPHSRYPISIMNKTPRATPPMSKRGFVRAEYKVIKKAWQRMTKTQYLIAQ
jgi:hypothetical protein